MMEFRPCIDLHEGKVKQIVGSTLTGGVVKTNFISDRGSAYFAELYCRDRLAGGHVIMLGPGNEPAAAEALAAFPGGMQVGGGINADNAQSWLDRGAAQVVLTSFIFSDGKLNMQNLRKICKLIGREKLVLDLSCRRRGGGYCIVTDCWQKFTSMEVNAATLQLLAEHCCEYLIHAVDVEGKQAGIDPDLLEIIAADSPVLTVYAGGIRSLDDIRLLQEKGQGKVAFTVGSALDIFGGRLKYRDVVDFVAAERSRNA